MLQSYQTSNNHLNLHEMMLKILDNPTLLSIIQDMAFIGQKIAHILKNPTQEATIPTKLTTYNASGEFQKPMDILANALFLERIKKNTAVCAIASEEEATVVKNNPSGTYIVALDPLDGSSNLDCNVPVGSIFSIYQRLSPIGNIVDISQDVLQKGNQVIVSGYILYSLQTTLVLTYQGVVYAFVLSKKEDFFFEKKIVMTHDNTIYSVNDRYQQNFSPNVQNFLQRCRSLGVNARYIGSLVADFHRNLLQGGIYLYPATKQRPHGKLRLLFECYPLALIAKNAGGCAVDEAGKNILDLSPAHLHACTPLYIGNQSLVKQYLDS